MINSQEILTANCNSQQIVDLEIKESLTEQDVFFDKKSIDLSSIQSFVLDQGLNAGLMKLKARKKEISKEIYKNKNNKEFDKNFFRVELKKINAIIRTIEFKELDFTESKLKLLVSEYKKWLNENFYLEFLDLDSGEYNFFRASKRGNSVYRYIVKEKLEKHTAFMENEKFKEFLLNDRHTKTRTLFITLTWDTNITLRNRKKAWRGITKFYNRFATAFRKKYGKTWFLRGIESTKQGYPHIHLIAITQKEFNVFEYNKEYRIKEKKEIENLWGSFIDVRVPKDLKSLRGYIMKDIIKQYNRGERKTDQDYLSLALCFIFRKQSYAISDFSRNDLINVCTIQTQVSEILDSNKEKRLIFEGIVKCCFHKDKPPPYKFVIKLSEDKKQDLEEYRITRGVINNSMKTSLIDSKHLARCVCASCFHDYEAADMQTKDICKFCFNNNKNRILNEFDSYVKLNLIKVC